MQLELVYCDVPSQPLDQVWPPLPIIWIPLLLISKVSVVYIVFTFIQYAAFANFVYQILNEVSVGRYLSNAYTKAYLQPYVCPSIVDVGVRSVSLKQVI